MPVTRRPVCLISLLFLIFILVTNGTPSPTWDVDAAGGRTVMATGVICDRSKKGDTFQVYLTKVTFTDISEGRSEENNSVKTYFPEKSKGIVVRLSDTDNIGKYIRIGSSIKVKGVFSPFERPRCEGMFDSRTYYMIRGYEGQLVRGRLLGVSDKYSYLKEWLRIFRDKAYDVLYVNMSADDAGLVAAMTLGDKSGLDSDIKELYQRAGISHVLALSGLHIASTGLALLSLLRRLGVRERTAAASSAVIIGLYAVMTGMSVSTVRALIMFLLSAGAMIIGRTYDLISAAAISAVVILAFNPYYVYDTGFLLSFMAIAAIAFIYPVLASVPRLLERPGINFTVKGTGVRRHRQEICKKLYQGICVSISVMLATLPIMANGFMQISVGSIVINLVVIPLMSVVLATGFSGIAMGLSGLNPGFLFKITHCILRFYELISKASAKNPINLIITGKPKTWQLITYAIILIIAVITGNIVIMKKSGNKNRIKFVDRSSRRNQKHNDRYPIIFQNKITYAVNSLEKLKKIRRQKIVFLIITAVIIMLSILIITYRKREILEIRNVDVGQGDCALLWGKSIPVIMIDGGSTDIKQAGKYRIVPVLTANRITAVEYCFLSHMDSDHVNAVMEMLEDDSCLIDIKRIVISELSYRRDKDNENMLRLISAVSRGKCGLITVSTGDVITMGDMRIEVLSPGVEDSAIDINGASLVLKASCGDFSALFTGDIGEDTERHIAGSIGNASYLKVAHHGSRTSSCESFVNAAMPQLSVISAGVDNPYGHPTAEALRRLADTGSRIFRTDTDGEIIVYVKPGRIEVEKYLH